jgi:hypothetical protein
LALAVPSLWRLVHPELEADLSIHCQRAKQVGSYQVLTANLLPLLDGDRIQIHAKFSRPVFVYLVAMNSAGEIDVLHSADGDLPVATEAVSVPAGRDAWLPLVPPGGVETILLLARQRPLGVDVGNLAQRLAKLGRPPDFDRVGLLVTDERGCRFVESPAVADRDISGETVTVEKGLLGTLISSGSSEWLVVKAVSFTHASRSLDADDNMN